MWCSGKIVIQLTSSRLSLVSNPLSYFMSQSNFDFSLDEVFFTMLFVFEYCLCYHYCFIQEKMDSSKDCLICSQKTSYKSFRSPVNIQMDTQNNSIYKWCTCYLGFGNQVDKLDICFQCIFYNLVHYTTEFNILHLEGLNHFSKWDTTL